MNCFCKIRTCAPSPSSTNSRKDKYTCNRTKDSADNASSSTYNEADSSANEAAQYSCFHSRRAVSIEIRFVLGRMRDPSSEEGDLPQALKRAFFERASFMQPREIWKPVYLD